jgi:hypothetical protein
VLDGSRKARFAFVALVVVGQGALALVPGRWSKHLGDLAPFRETSVARAELYRQVGAELVPVPAGEWNALDPMGTLRHFSWRERVLEPRLAPSGRFVELPHGSARHEAELRAALDDVWEHAQSDDETSQLMLVVTVRKNGRLEEAVRLTTGARAVRGPR